MSIKFSLINDEFKVQKLDLPTRFREFNEDERYIKLLSLGEGIFPNDKIKTSINMENSTLILSSESATKVYPSTKKFGQNSYKIELKNSNFEFINDELILYKNAKYRQNFKLFYDEFCTFFYVDILSKGVEYDFSKIKMKNLFFNDNSLEYRENFSFSNKDLKLYTTRHKTQRRDFAKYYIKTRDNKEFLKALHVKHFKSFEFTQNQDFLIGSQSYENMSNLKQNLLQIWQTYRHFQGKKEFDLGKY